MRAQLSTLWVASALFCWSQAPQSAAAQAQAFLPVPNDPRSHQPAIPAADHWSFVPIAGAKCRNDSDTGIGARLASGSKTLVIALQAGGACFSGISCGVNLNHYASSDFLSAAQNGGFDRGMWALNGSGLAGDSHVFIPYCTGDLFSGGGTAWVDGVGMQNFAGYKNMGLYIDYIVDTLLPLLGTVREVKFVGLSAGGFGALLNTPRLRDRLPANVKLSLLQDSAPPLDDQLFLRCHQKRLHDQWRFSETIRPVCGSRCSADNWLNPFFSYVLVERRSIPVALASNTNDQVIQLFGYASTPWWCFKDPTAAEYTAALGRIRAQIQASRTSNDGASYFITGSDHCFVNDDRYFSTTIGVQDLQTWVERQFERPGVSPLYDHVGP